MEIRECREQDWEQVWDLWELCHLKLPPGCACQRNLQCCSTHAVSLVIESGGSVLASAVGAWDGERGWICSVAVDPRLRRMRTASRLLQELESRLKAKGASYLITLVPKDNLEAQMLFESSEFSQMPDYIIMGKPLR